MRSPAFNSSPPPPPPPPTHTHILQVTSRVDLSAGLRQLAFLPLLQELNLAYTQIGDDGLQALEPLTSLTSLNLDSCEVTDA